MTSIFELAEERLCASLDQDLYLPVKDALKGRGQHPLGICKENFKGEIHNIMRDLEQEALRNPQIVYKFVCAICNYDFEDKENAVNCCAGE